MTKNMNTCLKKIFEQVDLHLAGANTHELDDIQRHIKRLVGEFEKLN